MNEKQYKRWESLRKMGKLCFVICYGAFGFGLFASVFSEAFQYLIDPYPFSWLSFLVKVPFWVVLGFFFGRFIWGENEAKRRKYAYENKYNT